MIILGEEITKRLIDGLMLDLRISTNPHLEEQQQKAFLQDLLDRRRQVWGPDDHSGDLDKSALEALKAQLKNNSKAIKVK